MSQADQGTKPWAAYTKEEKQRMAREARTAAQDRERARNMARRPPPPAPPLRTRGVPLNDNGLTVDCAVGSHSRCMRVLRCACLCHKERP